MADFIIELANHISTIRLFGEKVEVDRQESKNTAIAYLSFDADCLLYNFLVGSARIFRLSKKIQICR